MRRQLVVDQRTWKRLHILKLKYGFKTINELITAMLRVVTKFDVELKEFRNEKK